MKKTSQDPRYKMHNELTKLAKLVNSGFGYKISKLNKKYDILNATDKMGQRGFKIYYDLEGFYIHCMEKGDWTSNCYWIGSGRKARLPKTAEEAFSIMTRLIHLPSRNDIETWEDHF